jgi:hypothetical protein
LRLTDRRKRRKRENSTWVRHLAVRTKKEFLVIEGNARHIIRVGSSSGEVAVERVREFPDKVSLVRDHDRALG